MKENNPLIILGSARKNSNTKKLTKKLFSGIKYELIDLLDYKIFPYDYSGNYPEDDDFLFLMEQILKYNKIVFATPVYWYSMSGSMKVFFDRLTDVVTIKKEIGRQLKGKKTFMISVGTAAALPEGFEVPFRLTSGYFDMDFISSYYCSTAALKSELKGTHEIIEKLLSEDV